MAMDMDVMQPQSIRLLVEILTSIDGILAWIVRDSGLIGSEFQSLFETVWDDTHTRIEDAIRDLRSVRSEEHVLYRALSDHGLTGDSLELKVAIGRHLIDSAFGTEEARGSAPTILGFALKPVLKWINLILGSLANVFPPLGAVKEYKEAVELTVENRESAPVWDTRILKL